MISVTCSTPRSTSKTLSGSKVLSQTLLLILPVSLANEALASLLRRLFVKFSGCTHKRLGHPSHQTMVDAIKNDVWIGVPSEITPQMSMEATFTKINCTACQPSKSSKLAREEGSGIHPQFPGQVISVDYASRQNFSYCSRLLWLLSLQVSDDWLSACGHGQRQVIGML